MEITIFHFSLSLLQKLNGGITISRTMLAAANKLVFLCIPIFVTGTTHFVFQLEEILIRCKNVASVVKKKKTLR